MSANYHVVLCTCPDQDTATRIAHALLDRDLAACVNVVPGLRSIYRWKGKREEGDEVLLLIKARAAAYTQLEACIMEHHPYELAEIIALPIAAGSSAYLDWIEHDRKP
ncbi:MAG: divalent-cation tolerance protein CutA [Pseudomonadota bacterium]